jgi:hypothetical protein
LFRRGRDASSSARGGVATCLRATRAGYRTTSCRDCHPEVPRRICAVRRSVPDPSEYLRMTTSRFRRSSSGVHLQRLH